MKQKNMILMVVAVGCGLVAAFLTSQMSAKGQIEQVDVVVAAKDIPVGTTISREDLDKFVKIKKVPKDGLPPAYIVDKEMLVDKRLARPVRAEETFNPTDLQKGGAITLPPGYNMVSMPVGVGQAAAGFVGPGSRVDVIATVRLSNRLQAFPLLINMLVVAVDTQTTYTNNGVFPSMSMVSFAVKDKEALLLSLARSRGCTLELMLRGQDASRNENNDKRIDDMIKLLSDDRNTAKIVSEEHKKPETPEAAPAPSIPMIKVLIAKQEIAPNTLVTADLISTAFEWKEVPKELTADAMTDPTDALGKAFKNGVAKGQWVTWSMIGIPALEVEPARDVRHREAVGAEATAAGGPREAGRSREVEDTGHRGSHAFGKLDPPVCRSGAGQVAKDRRDDAGPGAGHRSSGTEDFPRSATGSIEESPTPG